MKDEVPLGKLAPEAATRDAIHIAVFPAICGHHRMRPGDSVGFVKDDGITVGYCDNPIGIVDPFLPGFVTFGERFYVCLYPNTITGMSHHWRHPAFDALPTPAQVAVGTEKSDSERWIENYCDKIGCRVDEIMWHAQQWILHEDYWCDGGRWEGYWLEDEFWTHYERVTGTAVPSDKRDNFFTCSC